MTQNEVTTCVLKSSFQWKDVKGTQTYSVALNLASAAKVRAIQDMYLRPLCKMAEEIVTYEALQSPFKTKIRQSHWVSLLDSLDEGFWELVCRKLLTTFMLLRSQAPCKLQELPRVITKENSIWKSCPILFISSLKPLGCLTSGQVQVPRISS